MRCQICHQSTSFAFNALILREHTANYRYCQACGYLYAQDPFWLDQAYASAIGSIDTGLVARNIHIADRLTAVLYHVLGERGHGSYLDAAGGYGMLVRLMRDYGFNFYWSDKYCDNILCKGFDFDPSQTKISTVTAFEVLEHLPDPLAFIQQTLSDVRADTLIFSTELFYNRPPEPGGWWYYAFEAGQHISFYQPRTLAVIAQKLGYHLYSYQNFHMFSQRPLNAWTYQLATGRFAPLLAKYAKRQLRSKTFADFEFLTNQSSPPV